MPPSDFARFVIPARYGFGVEVPEDGAHCSNCFYLGKSKEDCNNAIYRRYMGTSKFSRNRTAERFCCALWVQEDKGDLVPEGERL